MQTLLLCAGKSSRMWPLSDKIFFEYLGKSILQHQVEALIESGLGEKIHFVGNEQNLKKIQNILQQKFPDKFNTWTFSCQQNPEQGMMGGILAAQEKIDIQKPLLIMSSNDIVEKNFFEKLLLQYKKSTSDIFICGKKVENYFPGGYLEVNEENSITKIVEKPGAGNEPSQMINLVFHLFRNPEDLYQILQNEEFTSCTDDKYEICLQKLFDGGKKAKVLPYNGFWQALKYPWHHLNMMNYFLENIQKSCIHPSAKIADTVSISGNVIIESGVKIYDFAVITGPVYIGKNSILGNHCLVRSSHIGENCVIGHTTEIARSYLRKSIWTHQNYIGDSILDENVSFGAGTRTGNFRLDEQEISVQIKREKISTKSNKLGLISGKNTRTGINTSFMPGVKLGKDSFIGAGIVISEDVQEREFVYGKLEIQRKENKFEIPRRDL